VGEGGLSVALVGGRGCRLAGSCACSVACKCSWQCGGTARMVGQHFWAAIWQPCAVNFAFVSTRCLYQHILRRVADVVLSLCR
jgi:hypothetical protein